MKVLSILIHRENQHWEIASLRGWWWWGYRRCLVIMIWFSITIILILPKSFCPGSNPSCTVKHSCVSILTRASFLPPQYFHIIMRILVWVLLLYYILITNSVLTQKLTFITEFIRYKYNNSIQFNFNQYMPIRRCSVYVTEIFGVCLWW